MQKQLGPEAKVSLVVGTPEKTYADLANHSNIHYKPLRSFIQLVALTKFAHPCVLYEPQVNVDYFTLENRNISIVTILPAAAGKGC